MDLIPNTRHLLDPEILPLLDMIPSMEYRADTLAEIRNGIASLLPPVELPIAPVEKTIAGPDGPIEVFWFDPSPDSGNRPALLYIHGGGMIIGSARAMPQIPSTLAAELGVPVASVEYRLAPDTPFPGPQEDCYAALTWLARSAAELGIDPSRIGITGESAGGGLAAAVAQMARDRGGPPLIAQLLVYPMLDHRVGGKADPWRNQHTGEFVWTRSNNQFGWASLQGDYTAADERKGWFSPSLAEDLSVLPPTWIGVGTLDLFFDENLDYARRMVAAGVPVELHVYPGACHGFNALPDARLTKAFRHDFLSGAKRLLGQPPTPDEA